MSYELFVSKKLGEIESQGISATLKDYGLFPHQSDLVNWALRRGRAAIFADTGLGKSRMQVAWADMIASETGHRVIILAPLAVAEQTVEEAASIGVTIQHAREESDADGHQIVITNYDRLHKFDCSKFGAVVLDESSIIKHHTAKTLQTLLETFRNTPYRLACTATPAPNDWTELGNHAEFLGVRSRVEMLAEFFVHDGGDTQVWRLKGHARHLFWRWVASWGAMVRSPADLGHDASAYELPPLNVHQHTVEIEHNPQHGLFAMEAQTLMERRDARKQSMAERVKACVLLIKNENSKLAANVNGEFYDGLEERVRIESEAEGSSRPRLHGEAQCSIREGQRGSRRVHEGVLREESGEVQEADSGAAGAVQRQAAREVCDMRGNSGEGEVCCEVVGGEQPGREEGAEACCRLRDCAFRLQRNDGDAEQCVRDLRILGHERSEDVSCGGSLPHDWQGSRDPVRKLQSRSREVQGRRDEANAGCGVPFEKWLIWCDLNDEQDALERALQDEGISFVSIRGSTEGDDRVQRERDWRLGSAQVLISKSKIFGWGLNWQHCRRMAFVGVTDSFEAYYQAVRRCWRFGQKSPVDVHIFSSNQEGAVVQNLKRKEHDAKAMADAMATETIDAVRSEVLGRSKETNPYKPKTAMNVPSFLKEAA